MPGTPSDNTIIALLSIILSAGGIRFIVGIVSMWRNRETGEVGRSATVDRNIATVARVRDELGEDNNRLRMQIQEDRENHRAVLAERDARHAEERELWLADRLRWRDDVSRLEAQIESERKASAAREVEAQGRYAALLVQVKHLRFGGNDG